MFSLDNRTALVTGASAGLGWEFCRQLADRCDVIIAVARREERLLALLDLDRPYDLLHDLRHRSCRAEAVSAFLAILELARLDLARLHKTEAGEILLYRTSKELRAHELEAIQG